MQVVPNDSIETFPCCQNEQVWIELVCEFMHTNFPFGRVPLICREAWSVHSFNILAFVRMGIVARYIDNGSLENKYTSTESKGLGG